MIDGEFLLCWQKHWDRSPGTTTVMVRGPDPAGKSPDVNFVSVLRLGWCDFGLSRKLQTGFWKFKSILVSFPESCICLEHSPTCLYSCARSVINSLWIIHFPKHLVGYSKHVIWSWCKTRQWNRQRIDGAKSASTHLKAWHPNNQTKPVWIRRVKSRGLDMIWWSPFHTCWERWTVQGLLKSLGFWTRALQDFQHNSFLTQRSRQNEGLFSNFSHQNWILR